MKAIWLGILLGSARLMLCLSEKDPHSCSWDDVDAPVQKDASAGISSSGLNFTIGPKRFALDGKGIALLSGSVHYWRVPPEYWRRTLEALRDMGLNTVETYVPWSLHQPHPSVDSITFDKNLDVVRFLKLARSLGLMVIFRPGPYICSEMDLGGLPSWLLAKGAILRSADERYMEAVNVWFSQLIPLVAELQVTRGGPIIMVQVENEYGHRMTNGTNYLGQLVVMLRQSGIEIPLMTSDGMSSPQQIFWGGHIGLSKEYLFRTVNFGAALGMRAKAAFEMLSAVQPKMPLMAMELWCGWFDHWGAASKARVETKDVMEDVSTVLRQNGSFNLYMFHGGTNWGFTTGSLAVSDMPQYVTTSYDYDAPLSEGGYCTSKYIALQKRLLAWKKKNPELGRLGLEPFSDSDEVVQPFSCLSTAGDIKGAGVGRLDMQEWLPLLDCPDIMPPPVLSKKPLTMEKLPIHGGGGQGSGLIMYRAKVWDAASADNKTGLPQAVEVFGMRDRAQLWVSSRPGEASEDLPTWRSPGLTWERSLIERTSQRMNVPQAPTAGSATANYTLWLELLVENLGRVFMSNDFEKHLQEHRGIEKLRLRAHGSTLWRTVQEWEMIPLEFDPDHLKMISSSRCWESISGASSPAEDPPNLSKIKRGEGRPVLYRAIFHLPDAEKPNNDQWLDMAGAGIHGEPWQKGAVFVNGFNLGRFWHTKGPNQPLYLPAPMLLQGRNELIVLELHDNMMHHSGTRPSVHLNTRK